MEEKKSRVILHGTWASTYSKRVEIALKLKGISYQYIEEDLQNKSELLIQLNPVHKKIPVLVHDGKPVAESPVILEYIDETWKNTPRLFPEDPYERAQVRFWVSYINQQVSEFMVKVLFQEGEAQEKSFEEAQKVIKVLDEGLKKHFPNKIIKGNDDFGILEIIIANSFGRHKIFHEAVGVDIIDPVNTPTLYQWVESLQDLTVVKETKVPHDKCVSYLQNIRKKHLQEAKNA